jgi:hypothetical protein
MNGYKLLALSAVAHIMHYYFLVRVNFQVAESRVIGDWLKAPRKQLMLTEAA